MADQETAALVVDNSTRNCRAGVVGEDLPRTVLSGCAVEDRMAFYVGSDDQSKRDVLTLRYPIQCRFITNSDDMEKIWHHVFYKELQVTPEERPVLLSKSPRNFKSEEDKMTQIMFESFNVSAFYLAFQAVLSLFVSGRTNGVVLDIKNKYMDPLPVYEGHALRHTLFCMDLGGEDLADFLLQMLNKRGYHIKREEREMLEDIKEKLCYVALDFVKEMATDTSYSLEKQYELPDGQVITIHTERYRCPEGLFKPRYLNSEYCGIHEAVFHAVMKCDQDLRSTMFKNVMLAGGTSMFSGFAERLQIELVPLPPLNKEVNIIAPLNRTCSAWVGRSLIVSLPHFADVYQQKGV